MNRVVFSLFSEHVLLYPLDVLRRQIQVTDFILRLLTSPSVCV